MSQLDDIDEIRQLIARYCHLVDSGEIEAWVECFTDDGVLEVPGIRTEGREALLAMGAGIRENAAANPSRHVVTNVLIDVDGDQASSQSYLIMVSASVPPVLRITGTYRDRIRRVDGRWRFAERVATFDGTPAG